MGNQQGDTDWRTTDRGISSDPFAIETRFSRRLCRSLGSRLLVGIVIAGASVGLTSLGTYMNHLDRGINAAVRANSGVIDHFEVLRIWVPATLKELAISESASTMTLEEFQRFLEREHQEDLWFAFTVRAYQLDGDFCDCTYIRYPYKHEYSFPEAFDNLAVAAGQAPGFGMTALSNASIIVLPEGASKRQPREVVGELIGVPSVAIPR
jgi:hypothetical protein